MATIGLSGGLAATFANWFGSTRRDFAEENERRQLYRATFAELDHLSDRDLADIGIRRGEIADIARDAAYGNNS